MNLSWLTSVKGLKKQILIGASSVLVCVIAYFAISHFYASEVISQEKQKQNVIKKIEFKTDGVIDSKFISKFLRLKAGTSLYSIDIFDMKKQLESIAQIKQAHVERKFPDTLFIAINERKPILKIAVKDGDLKKLLLVDLEDGEIFDNVCYNRENLSNILFADVDVVIDPSTGRFKKIDRIDNVLNLIKLVQVKQKNLLPHIIFISLRRYDPRPGALWSRIEFRTKLVKTIVFSDMNFGSQLDKLDYILSDPNIIKLLPLSKIDLSNPANVIINN